MESKPNLYYETHGSGGPHLLMVHGFLSSRAQWLPNLEALEKFCRPVIVELFGHGRSPSPSDLEMYSPKSYAAEFEKIRDQLNIDKWFICGQSLGAALSFRYVLTHPERVLGHIFTNSRSALNDESFKEGTQRLVELLNKEGRAIIEQLPLHPGKTKRIPAEVKDALIKDIEMIDLEGFANTAQFTTVPSSVRTIVHKNSVPTLLIAGKYDKLFQRFMDEAPDLVPHLEMIVVEAGHAVNIGAAEEFNAAVERFMKVL